MLDIKSLSVQAVYIRFIIYFMIVLISAYLLFKMHNQSFHYLCFKQNPPKKLNKQISIITQDWWIQKIQKFPKAFWDNKYVNVSNTR